MDFKDFLDDEDEGFDELEDFEDEELNTPDEEEPDDVLLSDEDYMDAYTAGVGAIPFEQFHEIEDVTTENEEFPEETMSEETDKPTGEGLFEAPEPVMEENVQVETSSAGSEAHEEMIKVIDNTKLTMERVGSEAMFQLFGKIANEKEKEKTSIETQENASGSKEQPALRKFSSANRATVGQVVYAEPVNSEKTKLQRAIPYIIVVLAIGAFFAVKANSYYVFKSQYVTDIPFSRCMIGWAMQENLPTVLNPLVPEIFFPAFLTACAIASVFSLIIWSKSEGRIASRVGHEHGNTHLGTSSDYNKFRAKFMDNEGSRNN